MAQCNTRAAKPWERCNNHAAKGTAEVQKFIGTNQQTCDGAINKQNQLKFKISIRSRSKILVQAQTPNLKAKKKNKILDPSKQIKKKNPTDYP